MQCGSCGGFFPFPQSENAPDENYIYCAKCRSPSWYDYSYTAKEYEHETVTNQFYVFERDDY